jgi:hypothetical protein
LLNSLLFFLGIFAKKTLSGRFLGTPNTTNFSYHAQLRLRHNVFFLTCQELISSQFGSPTLSHRRLCSVDDVRRRNGSPCVLAKQSRIAAYGGISVPSTIHQINYWMAVR